jgi:hypothetical protein
MKPLLLPVLLLSLCAIHGRCHASEQLKRRFLAEYPKGAAALESFYSKCRITATQTTLSDGNIAAVHLLIYSVNGGVAQVTAVKKAGFPVNEIGEQTVFLITADRPYTLVKFPRTDKFVVQAALSRDKIWSTFRRDVLPAFAPYCVPGTRFTDIMSDPSFRITDVSELMKSERPCIKVTWESKVDHNGDLRKYGSVVMSPRDSWAIQEYELMIRNPAGDLLLRNTMSVSYQGESDNVPLVDSVTLHRPGRVAAAPALTKRYDEISIVSETVPPNEFTLQAYGVETLAKVEGSRWNVFFIAANVLIVASLLFRYLARRSRSRST